MKTKSIANMKSITVFIFSALILASCGGDKTGNESLDALIAKRDSLKQVQTNIGKQLEEVEIMIAELDTSIKAQIVTTMTVSRHPFDAYFQVQGSVSTDAQANVYPNPQGQGTIKRIYVREGDRVSAGQKLAQVDDAVIRQSLGQLEVNLNMETENFNRLKKLWDQQIGSEMQMLQAKRAKENIEEQMKQLKEQLAQYIITSPISGTIDKIYSKEGESAMLGSPYPLLTVLSPGNVYLLADVSENYISVVREGQRAQVIFQNTDTIETTVSRIGNSINKANRTFEVKLGLPQGDSRLKPNLVGAVRFVEYHADSAVVLPSSLIMKDAQDRPFVFAIENTRSKKALLQTGKSYEGLVEITSGLSGNETIINKGARKLVDGQEIRIQNN
jgi:RND family efflux transporter MFP subunit